MSKIYVLQVASGKEQHICTELARVDIKAYAPVRESLERYKGSWRIVTRILFAGYVFVEVKELTAHQFHKIKKTDGVLKILGQPPTPLLDSETQRLKWILTAGVLTISNGYINSDGKLIITSGQLYGKENQIISYNKRQQRAIVEVKINGESHRFTASVKVQ